jgi:hypothetical protein
VCSQHPRTSPVQFLQFLSSMHLYCICFALAVCLHCTAGCEQRQSCGDDGLPPVFLAVPYQQYHSTQANTLQLSLGAGSQGAEPGARSDSSSTVLDSRQESQHTSTLSTTTGTTPTTGAAARQLITTETPQGSVSRVTVAGLGMAGSGTSSTSSSNSGSGGFNQPEPVTAPSTTGSSQNVVNGFTIPTEQAFHTKADYSAVGAPRPVAGLVLCLLSVAALWVLNV